MSSTVLSPCPSDAEETLVFPLENQTSKIEDSASQPSDLKKRRRGPQSKIARLPTELRALVNQLLDQDKTYEQVVEEMATHGVSLNTDNVSKWFNGPYQDYLAALDWQDELQQLRDHAFNFGQQEGNVRFQEGLVQIGLTQLFRAIQEDRFKEESANSLRLFNSLARLSREALVIRKYADQQAKEKTERLRRLDPNRQISDAEEMAMQDRADDFFGWKSAERLKRALHSVGTESPPSPPLGTTVEVPIPNRESSISDSSSPAIASEPPTAPEPPIQSLTNPAPGEVGRVTPCAPPTTRGEPRTADCEPRTTDEQCHYCRKSLPPRLPTGQRPFTHCQLCGTALRPIELLHLWCPACGYRLDALYQNNRLTTDQCPQCQGSLSDVPPPPNIPSAA